MMRTAVQAACIAMAVLVAPGGPSQETPAVRLLVTTDIGVIDRPVSIEVVQASIRRERAKEGFPPIPLERTSVTGLRHKDGTVSMARSGPDSATSSFFVCINDQPSLDFGGARNADGQGFAAFGRVVHGMDVVRKIHNAPAQGETLTPPVRIVKIERALRAEFGETVRPDPDQFGIIGDVVSYRTHDPSLTDSRTSCRRCER